MATVVCPSFTFAACDAGKENWHNKGRNSMAQALALRAECEAKGMRCTSPKEITIEHEVVELMQESSR